MKIDLSILSAKTAFPVLLTFAIGCQKPCTTTTPKIGYYGDTTYINRVYANCSDTLNYYERHVKKDSTVISEGQVENGLKEGDWKTYWSFPTTTSYIKGQEVGRSTFYKDGSLMQEEKIGADSLFAVRSFYKDGTMESEGLKTLDGFTTGHWVEYDLLGQKTAEGGHIAEPVLPDTMYIESPEPPYDLQMTIITENGGRHGPWIFFDAQGAPIDTVMYDRGVPIGKGSSENTGIEEVDAVTDNATETTQDLEKKSPNQ